MQSDDSLNRCSDEELLERFCHGQAEAFGDLVRRYERELYGYLRRYLGDGSLAEDVFQNTFLQVYVKSGQYEAGRPVRPWLYTIATHQAIDAMRRNGRHQAVSLDETWAEGGEGEVAGLLELLQSRGPSPVEAATAQERQEQVRASVERLPDFLRQVLLLAYYQGLKYREIADILEIPVGTVKSRLHAALVKLQEAWAISHPCTKSETMDEHLVEYRWALLDPVTRPGSKPTSKPTPTPAPGWTSSSSAGPPGGRRRGHRPAAGPDPPHPGPRGRAPLHAAGRAAAPSDRWARRPALAALARRARRRAAAGPRGRARRSPCWPGSGRPTSGWPAPTRCGRSTPACRPTATPRGRSRSSDRGLRRRRLRAHARRRRPGSGRSRRLPRRRRRPAPPRRSRRRNGDAVPRDPAKYHEAACDLAGRYAYSLGYLDESRITGLRRDSGDNLPLLADVRRRRGNSRNHGGAGQNVLHVGGQVRWCVHPGAGIDGDNIYLNQESASGRGCSARTACWARATRSRSGWIEAGEIENPLTKQAVLAFSSGRPVGSDDRPPRSAELRLGTKSDFMPSLHCFTSSILRSTLFCAEPEFGTTSTVTDDRIPGRAGSVSDRSFAASSGR